MGRDDLKSFAIPALDISKRSIADTGGFLQHCVKHGLHIAGRVADDLKDLRRSGLLLKGLTQLT
jgi:hypothetical protein